MIIIFIRCQLLQQDSNPQPLTLYINTKPLLNFDKWEHVTHLLDNLIHYKLILFYQPEYLITVKLYSCCPKGSQLAP